MVGTYICNRFTPRLIPLILFDWMSEYLAVGIIDTKRFRGLRSSRGGNMGLTDERVRVFWKSYTGDLIKCVGVVQSDYINEGRNTSFCFHWFYQLTPWYNYF